MIILSASDFAINLAVDSVQMKALQFYLEAAMFGETERLGQPEEIAAKRLHDIGFDIDEHEVLSIVHQATVTFGRLLVGKELQRKMQQISLENEASHVHDHEHDEDCPFHPDNIADPKKVN